MSEEKKEQTQNAQLDPSQWKAGPLAFVEQYAKIQNKCG